MKPKMDAALRAAVQRYVERNPRSQMLYETALESLPGGNTRSALYTSPFPISMCRGEGYKLYDEDGHEYADFVGELTAGIYGHSNTKIKDAIVNTLETVGFHLGATTAYEQRYASYLCQRFGIDRIRFTNSGTEANIHCIAAARRFTSRRKVVVFRGGYHGSVLSFAAGIAANNIDPCDWVVCQYNDVCGVEQAFEQPEDIAAVILEGMQGSGGAIRASPEFLKAVRQCSAKAGAVFILDEVITSRLAPRGIKDLIDVSPDMVTYGKYLGGGMPFGAFGGRKEIMEVYDPRAAAALGHSGTFQNNPIMLNAGYIAMSEVYSPAVVAPFNARGDKMREQLQTIFHGSRLCVTGRGTIMCIHATRTGMLPEQINCKDAVSAVEDHDLKKLFWLEILEAGFWVLLRGSLALNLQIQDDTIAGFLNEVQRFCDRYRELISV